MLTITSQSPGRDVRVYSINLAAATAQAQAALEYRRSSADR